MEVGRACNVDGRRVCEVERSKEREVERSEVQWMEGEGQVTQMEDRFMGWRGARNRTLRKKTINGMVPKYMEDMFSQPPQRIASLLWLRGLRVSLTRRAMLPGALCSW